jgi:integrase
LEAAGSVRDVAWISVMFAYGVRPSEIGLISMQDLDLAARTIRITRLRGISATMPLLREPRLALVAWIRLRGKAPGPVFLSRHGVAISRYQVDKILKRLAAAAGVPKHKAHARAIRHTRGVALGHDSAAAQMYLGVVSESAVKRYIGPERLDW